MSLLKDIEEKMPSFLPKFADIGVKGNGEVLPPQRTGQDVMVPLPSEAELEKMRGEFTMSLNARGKKSGVRAVQEGVIEAEGAKKHLRTGEGGFEYEAEGSRRSGEGRFEYRSGSKEIRYE